MPQQVPATQKGRQIVAIAAYELVSWLLAGKWLWWGENRQRRSLQTDEEKGVHPIGGA